jgi:uncharacterized protein (DUF427 family)/diadenosine tetraphosphate (Ap4A) HIT family hydrolase
VAFELHPRLADDGVKVGNFALCALLLNNDARFPWCILVPRIEGLRDFHEVPAARRGDLFAEIERVSVALAEIGHADKMNVAALGNMVPQLHIHVIARRTDDAAWPAPVWSVPGAQPYADPQSLVAQLRAKLGLNPAPGYAKHPDHRVDISPTTTSVVVEFAGATIASTRAPLLVDESRHSIVYYVRRADVRMDLLTPTDHTSYCPYKGTARYWTIDAGGRRAENAVWAYDEPYDEALPLKGHVAFYADRVDRISIDGRPDR